MRAYVVVYELAGKSETAEIEADFYERKDNGYYFYAKSDDPTKSHEEVAF